MNLRRRTFVQRFVAAAASSRVASLIERKKIRRPFTGLYSLCCVCVIPLIIAFRLLVRRLYDPLRTHRVVITLSLDSSCVLPFGSGGGGREKPTNGFILSHTHPCRVDCTDIPQHHPRLNWFFKVPSADCTLHMRWRTKINTEFPRVALLSLFAAHPNPSRHRINELWCDSRRRLLTCHLSIVVVNNKIQETVGHL